MKDKNLFLGLILSLFLFLAIAKGADVVEHNLTGLISMPLS